MNKGIYSFLFVVFALYGILHIVLGSSPVQKRIFEKTKEVLSDYGIEVNIQSIEFSTFLPKIYLNQIVISAKQNSIVGPFAPIEIDKVKISFQPLALLSRKILIKDLVVYHPKVFLPELDKMIHKISTRFSKKEKSNEQLFSLELQRFSIVDALMDIGLVEQGMTFKSRSFSVTQETSLLFQKNIRLTTQEFEFTKGQQKYPVSFIDIDADYNPTQVKLRMANIKLDQADIKLSGQVPLPLKFENKIPKMNIQYELNVPLPFLNSYLSFKKPKLDGVLISKGDFNTLRSSKSGEGQVAYKNLFVDGYRIGDGAFEYGLSGKKVLIKDPLFQYGGGEIKGRSVTINLNDNLSLSGELRLNKVLLEGILECVKADTDLVKMKIDGDMQFTGQLLPFGIEASIQTQISDLWVKDNLKAPLSFENSTLHIPDGKLNGVLNFSKDKMAFKTTAEILSGSAVIEGYLGFNSTAKFNVTGDKINLSRLKKISDLQIGGIAQIKSQIEVNDQGLDILGQFSLQEGSLADLTLGSVKGMAQFKRDMLSFSNIELKSKIDTITGSGYVDFAPKKTHYKIDIQAKRAGVEEFLKVFEKYKINTEMPTQGEIAAKITVEGGHDSHGLEVVSSGQARSLNWYGEKWNSAYFLFSYRTGLLQIDKLTLLKKMGSLEVKGRLLNKEPKLVFTSQSLRLEELDMLGNAPFTGEIVGRLSLENDFSKWPLVGDLKLVKASYRGSSIGDSSIQFTNKNDQLHINANLFQGSFKTEIVREGHNFNWNSTYQMKDLEALYFLSLYLKKEIPTFSEFKVTGSGELMGTGFSFEKLRGEGILQNIKLNTRNSVILNQKSIAYQFNQRGFHIDKFILSGQDNQLNGELHYLPNQLIQLGLEAKTDLQLLLPFISGLEFGSGKLNLSMRVNGHPEKYNLVGNLSLDEGTLKLSGISDELQNVQVKANLSQEKIIVDKFEAVLGSGKVSIGGDVKYRTLADLYPNLKIQAQKITLNPTKNLKLKLNGDFSLKSKDLKESKPYIISGKCELLEGELSSLESSTTVAELQKPLILFDIKCEAPQNLMVKTEILNGEYKGQFHLMGNNEQIGLVGNADSISGSVLFRDTKFNLENSNVRFESESSIAPRFNVLGRTYKKENKLTAPQQFEVSLQVFGTPKDYKIRLSSIPSLAEGDIIALLVLGVANRSQDGNYYELGTTLVGQTPLQSKIQNEIGLDIKLGTSQSNTANPTQNQTTQSSAFPSVDSVVPNIQIQKEITNRTKITYSNTLETNSYREFKLEHLLDDNLSANFTAVDKPKSITETQSVQSFGLDFRYRFQFE